MLWKIGRIVTMSPDLLSFHVMSLHVPPKKIGLITNFCDLCTKHMEISFFLKRDKTLVLIKVKVFVLESKYLNCS